MNKLRIPCSDCVADVYGDESCSDCVADVYGDVKNTCGMYTSACAGDQDTCLVQTTLTAKMHIHPRKYARVMLQQCLRHANQCDLTCNLTLPKKPPDFKQPMVQPQQRCRTSII